MSSFAEHVKEEINRKTFTSKAKVCKIEQVLSGAGRREKRAFLRDAFLRTGSMSDPAKAYHLEYVCDTQQEAEAVRTLLSEFDIRAGMFARTGKHVVYLKSGDAIASLLRVLGAHVSLMEMENNLIYKDMRNNVNRRVNCDTANIAKTVHASARQTEAILYLESIGELDRLEESLREAARLRLNNPDASIGALADMMEPPLTKSGMNHRLQKILETEQSLRKARGSDGEEEHGKNNRG